MANLEGNEPNALDDVADNQEVLHSPERRNVHPDVKERHADQALILVKCSHKDLGVQNQSRNPGRTGMPLNLLPHGRHQIPIHTAYRSNGPLSIVPTVQAQLVPPFASRVRIGNDLHHLKDVRL